MPPILDSLSIANIAGLWARVFLPLALKGSVLLGILLLVTGMMRGASASGRHFVLALGLAGLLLLPAIEMLMPSWRVLPFPSAGWKAEAAYEGARGAEQSPSSEPATSRTAPVAAPSEAEAVQVGEAAMGAKGATGHTLKDGRRPFPGIGPHSQTAFVWGFSIWISGVLLLGASLLSGAARLRRLRDEGRPLVHDGWPALVSRIGRDLGITAPPVLLRSPRATAPMTWGLRRHVVLLPPDCDGWALEQRREVLLHELAHVRRRDCLTQFVAQLACALYWFNPIVWMTARRMRTERERACDDRVLVAGVKPSSYASHLLDFARRLDAKKLVMSPGLAMARRSRIFERLDSVLDPRLPRGGPRRPMIAMVTVLTLATLLPLASLDTIAQTSKSRSKIVKATTGGDSQLRVTETAASPSLPPSNFIAEHSGSDREISWKMETDGETLKLEMRGEIEFSEDNTAVVWMEEGAYFRMERKKGRKRIRIEAEPGEDGKPVYEYKVGRRTMPFDEEAAAELAQTLPRIMLELGVNADRRVREAHERHGLQGVLELIDRVDSDYSRGMYYAEYFTLSDLGDAEVNEALTRLSGDIDSDYMMASALRSFVNRRELSEGTREGFLRCISSIDSDHEKSRVLRAALHKPNPTHAGMSVAISAAREIDSDYESAQVLTAVDPEVLYDDDISRVYFDAFARIDSDYQKAEVLLSLAAFAREHAGLREACLDAADGIGSDYQYGRVVKALR